MSEHTRIRVLLPRRSAPTLVLCECSRKALEEFNQSCGLFAECWVDRFYIQDVSQEEPAIAEELKSSLEAAEESAQLFYAHLAKYVDPAGLWLFRRGKLSEEKLLANVKWTFANYA
ncbi:MAG: hypothetical protein A2942_04170 [Candidatus Lloydbacteria bacterium RIFCSPLOWO2_01_FULL_50_20]|uniref:Uncharacterized protein n=1 Tax=Candidatus Lloydbacteria bacterium RIFCSPLOWO2_01_FULL_50_20 TaxID=1798665 RepID=A0A1G2DCL4_9BACT|nr:MAG: hypothetical protein A3C13_00275 [Candidatus Lloydbacteria bacterium RIFCSPHIGHO2_02_FULL_50_11]OGZ11379.1 MAG: hypothetical protein A2942_04170 [Candidatus Lloydbacteria bacterium RIFCSPLOWO2_01_FULL_50_20]